MNVLAIQHDIAWEDKQANHATVEDMLDAARPPQGATVVLAELFDTGFSFNLDAIVDARTVAWGQSVAAARSLNILCGHAERGGASEADGARNAGEARRADDRTPRTTTPRGRNCLTLIAPGGVVRGRYEKVHPFTFGREGEHYGGGSRLLLRRIDGATVCPLICYDLRFPELWRLAALAGAEVFLLGASWPAARQHHWRALCIARAIENQAYVVAVNRVGRDPTLAYAGGSLVVDPRGKVIAEAGDAPMTLAATLDLADLRAWRAQFPALRDAHREFLGAIAIDDDAPSISGRATALHDGAGGQSVVV
ncbi:MAG: nitrilase-related carbon-nitrogen hydrolase [Phycisphaerales bacterium]